MLKIQITGGGHHPRYGKLWPGRILEGDDDLRSLVEGGIAVPFAGAEDVPAFPPPVPGPWAANARETVAHVRALRTALEVTTAHELERRNPRWPGGRRSVLDACEERLGELGVRNPNRDAEHG